MLNGIEPIIIFQFKALAPSLSDLVAQIPVVSKFPSLIEMPPIPVYLSQSATGIYIESEDKNVDISTETQTMSDGSEPKVDQKGIGNVVRVNITGKKDSLGLALVSALIDQVFDKVTSKEYAISYLHGATTIFQGQLHSYSVQQNSSNELLTIAIELTKGTQNPTKPPDVPIVGKITGAVPL